MDIEIDVDEAVDDGATLIRVTMSEAGLQIVFNMTWDEAHELRTGLAKAMIAARFPDLNPPSSSSGIAEPPKLETMNNLERRLSQENDETNVVGFPEPGKKKKRAPKEPS
jgi:hypothetical protein